MVDGRSIGTDFAPFFGILDQFYRHCYSSSNDFRQRFHNKQLGQPSSITFAKQMGLMHMVEAFQSILYRHLVEGFLMMGSESLYFCGKYYKKECFLQ
ncbi:uncharacterized protein LOC131248528 isoform X10 [Magnolia sinica]|uniref:uncharacterized protein LOC131248528 isoform X10 n=1 Tax=Magnolia sinica TaxID=86752 RepID=UPI00265834EB|nr:uncharacterized protein LOC131248528 isoform X10 [Magnolia sinica]